MKQIILDKYSPREYQIPIIDAIENKGYKRVLACLPRRSGKDVTALNILLRSAIMKVGVYFYILPTYRQAKKVIWDSIDNNGNRFMSYIPEQLVESRNSQELSTWLTNGSLIQLVGSKDIDSLMGTNPRACVFSEYALQDPAAYQFISPILRANNGWALFISTPRGKNSFYDMYKMAQQSKEWFCYKLTLDDTKHIPLSEIQKERDEGIMSEDLIQQEYYTSFDMGVEGSYYAKYLDLMRLEERIDLVPYENQYKVHTAWDIGYTDSCAIIFFQIAGRTIKIIDYYEKAKEGLEHYVKVVLNKPYIYGTHIVPHDMKVTEFGSGISRINKALQLGLPMQVSDSIGIEDGIELCRSTFSKLWIDEKKCSGLIKALENYRQEWDVHRQRYKTNPLHNWASHGADAFRYMCINLHKLEGNDTTPEELRKRYNRVRYGGANDVPPQFQNHY